ncbi:hypothetical protein AB1Y20_022819 [Prymnesium parvum]|uniref:PH domain-containing protein n=1 Tax=Prymnesium parvum TaxID=97485 RepID=A0AB34JEU5_PRYPA
MADEESRSSSTALQPRISLPSSHTAEAAPMADIVEALREGDALALRSMLTHNPEALTSVWTDNNSLLHMAAEEGHEAVVDMLLGMGAVTSRVNAEGQTPLHLAAMNGHKRVISQLLRHGGSPHTVDEDGQSPLHVAAMNGHVGVAAFLIAASGGTDCAEMHLDDKYHMTPFHLACEGGHDEVVALLLAALSASSSPHANMSRLADTRGSAYFLAAQQAHNGVMALFDKTGSFNNMSAELASALSEASLPPRIMGHGASPVRKPLDCPTMILEASSESLKEHSLSDVGSLASSKSASWPSSKARVWQVGESTSVETMSEEAELCAPSERESRAAAACSDGRAAAETAGGGSAAACITTGETTSRVVHEGWLSKRSVSARIMKNWQRRWIVLYPKRIAWRVRGSFLKTQGLPAVHERYLPLDKHVKLQNVNKSQLKLKVVASDGRELQLQASSSEDIETWRDKISTVLAQL